MTATEWVDIPAREGRAVELRAGDTIRVIDVEGGQVADLFAFKTADVHEHLSAQHTRVCNDSLFPLVGESFVTNRRRPILVLEADDSPGIHDMLIAACDPERYEGLGVRGWHASCQENMQQVMARVGHEGLCVPQSVNLFMNIPVDGKGRLAWAVAPTKAGDSVTLRAISDCHVVVSACPQDIIVINDRSPGPIALEITRDA